MIPPLPVGAARYVAGFGIGVGHHDVAIDPEQRQVGGLVALRLPGCTVSVGERLDAGIGNERHHVALQPRASAARPGSIGANQSGG